MLKGLDEAVYSPQWDKNLVYPIHADICPSKEILLTSIALSLNRIAVESESIATALLTISSNMTGEE